MQIILPPHGSSVDEYRRYFNEIIDLLEKCGDHTTILNENATYYILDLVAIKFRLVKSANKTDLNIYIRDTTINGHYDTGIREIRCSSCADKFSVSDRYLRHSVIPVKNNPVKLHVESSVFDEKEKQNDF